MNRQATTMKQIECLLVRLRPRIISIGGGNDTGDDLFGDVCLACIQKVDRYSWDDPRIEGRVIQIALNLNARRLKKRERHQSVGEWPIEDSSLIGQCDSSLYRSDRGELAEQAKRLVEQLPVKDQQIIWSHFKDNELYESIASRFQMTAVNVRTRLCRALKTLRHKLNPQ